MGWPRLPRIQGAKPCLDAKGQAFLEADSSAQQEGRRQARRDLILRQAMRRFGPNDEAAAVTAAITEPEEFDGLAQRVLTAADWSSLLARS